MPDVLWAQLLPLSVLYLVLGIWGFDYARRRSSLLISVAYLLIEFAIGMRINTLWGGGLPADSAAARAQAVILLPRLFQRLTLSDRPLQRIVQRAADDEHLQLDCRALSR
jgi:hypothetical protein